MVTFKLYNTENSFTLEFSTPSGTHSFVGVTEDELRKIYEAIGYYLTPNNVDETKTTMVWNPRSKRHEFV